MNTTYFLNRAAEKLFKSVSAPLILTDYYIGLSTTAPTLTGENVSEPPASAGYARVKLEYLSEPVNGMVSNTSPVIFEESTADWGVISHYVIFDSPTVGEGSALIYGELPVKHDVKATNTMTIKTGNLKLRVENPA